MPTPYQKQRQLSRKESICVRINCVECCHYKFFLNFVQQCKPAPSICPEHVSPEKHLTSNFPLCEETIKDRIGPSFFVSYLYRMLTCRRRSSTRDMAYQSGPIGALGELVSRLFDKGKDVQFLHRPSQSICYVWTLLTKYPQDIRWIVFAAQFSVLYKAGRERAHNTTIIAIIVLQYCVCWNMSFSSIITTNSVSIMSPSNTKC